MLFVMQRDRDVIVKWGELGEIVMKGVERVLVIGGRGPAVMIWLGAGHRVGGGGGGPRHVGGWGHGVRKLRINVVVMLINVWLELWQSIEHRGERLDHLLRISLIVLLVVMR